jgi:DNA transformation protein
VVKKADAFRDFVLDQLREVPGVEARAMFGGHGLYKGDKIFGILYKGRFYLKIPPKPGLKPFKPFPDKKSMKYFEVPADVLESSPELARWVDKAFGHRS